MSFARLQKETGLFDVTLVTNDQQQLSAHRLVLSACSDFFKTIFYSNTHSHPLLYLDGVDSTEINLMLDYIYRGEVQIYHEYLDRFLSIAKKFNLDGLIVPNEESDNYKHEDKDVIYQESKEYNQEHNFESPKIVKERSVKVVTQTFEAQNSEVDAKFEELVVSENGIWRCTVCDKTMKMKRDMRRHLETHLSGLSYECQFCGKSFRSNDVLRKHKSRSSCIKF